MELVFIHVVRFYMFYRRSHLIGEQFNQNYSEALNCYLKAAKLDSEKAIRKVLWFYELMKEMKS